MTYCQASLQAVAAYFIQQILFLLLSALFFQLELTSLRFFLATTVLLHHYLSALAIRLHLPLVVATALRITATVTVVLAVALHSVRLDFPGSLNFPYFPQLIHKDCPTPTFKFNYHCQNQ